MVQVGAPEPLALDGPPASPSRAPAAPTWTHARRGGDA